MGYTEHPKKSLSCFCGIQIDAKMTTATESSAANEVNIQQNDLSINDADQLQTKMSNSIFSRVDEMGRKIGELESKIMQVVNEATVQSESVITAVSSDIPAIQS